MRWVQNIFLCIRAYVLEQKLSYNTCLGSHFDFLFLSMTYWPVGSWHNVYAYPTFAKSFSSTVIHMDHIRYVRPRLTWFTVHTIRYFNEIMDNVELELGENYELGFKSQSIICRNDWFGPTNCHFGRHRSHFPTLLFSQLDCRLMTGKLTVNPMSFFWTNQRSSVPVDTLIPTPLPWLLQGIV